MRSPVNGFVTNLTASVGDYATTGTPVVAIVDSDSFYVYAYFMETKLPAVRDGDRAQVELMAGNVVIEGRVQGVSRGIYETGVDRWGRWPTSIPTSPGCAWPSACRSGSPWGGCRLMCA